MAINSAAPPFFHFALDSLITTLGRNAEEVLFLLGGPNVPSFEPLLSSRNPLPALNILFSHDPLGDLYQKLVPRKIRLDNGEFFTPFPVAQWLIRHLHEIDYRTEIPLDGRSNAPQEYQEYTGKLDGNSPADFCGNGQECPFYTVLDPACGTGVFLTAVLSRRIQEGCPREKLLDGLVGFDINPQTVLLARASLLLTLLRSVPENERDVEWARLLTRTEQRGSSPFEVYLYDSVTGKTPARDPSVPWGGNWDDSFLTPPDRISQEATFDVVLGNPPWISWDRLDPVRKEASMTLWQRYGLFSLTGQDARYGGAKKEFASLMVYVVADRFLRDQGHLAMLLPLSLFQTRLAGSGFRRFCIPERNIPLGVAEIHDFSQVNFFPGVASRLAVLFLKKGNKTHYPVPWFSWSWPAGKKWQRRKIPNNLEAGLSVQRETVVPEFPEEPGSPLTFIAENEIENETETQVKTSNGEGNRSGYTAQLGCNTGGANGIFWLTRMGIEGDHELWAMSNQAARGKKPIESLMVILESELLYPLLRWSGVGPYSANPDGWILLTQDVELRRGLAEELLRNRYPLCFQYLSRFEEILRSRAIFRKFQHRYPYWSMYNVSRATLSPVKVVWRRMDSVMRAAVVLPDPVTGKPVIPQETLSMVAVDSEEEADYLAAVLNSEETATKITRFGQTGTKGFGSPGMLPRLGIARFDTANPEHIRLAAYGKQQREDKTRRENKQRREIKQSHETNVLTNGLK